MLEGWFFWAVGAAFIWGVGQVVVKRRLSLLTPLIFNFLSLPVDFLVFIPYALYSGVDLAKITPLDLGLAIFILSSYIFYFYIVSLGEISLTGTIISTFPLSTVFFSVVFLGERLGTFQLIFIFLIVLGVVLIGWPREGGLKLERWFWFAVFTALLVGFADFLAKILIGRIGVNNLLLIYGPSFLPALRLAFLLDKKGRVWPRVSPKDWFFSLLGASMVTGGGLFLFTALETGPASLVVPVSAFYTPVTIILALIFLKEKLSRLQALGLALTILGVVLIGI